MKFSSGRGFFPRKKLHQSAGQEKRMMRITTKKWLQLTVTEHCMILDSMLSAAPTLISSAENSKRKWLIIYPFYRWRDWGSVRLGFAGAGRALGITGHKHSVYILDGVNECMRAGIYMGKFRKWWKWQS